VKSILKFIPLVLAVVIGAVGADFLKQSNTISDPVNSASGQSKKDASGHNKKSEHGKAADKTKLDKKEKESDGGHDGGKLKETRYLKFKRQFVIPVMKDQKVGGLVLMNFNLELNEDAGDEVFSEEPKLRDAYMRVLLQMSSEGAFDGDLVSPATYEQLRYNLITASTRIIDEGVEDVLILDIVKQDN
jgi:flagellar FliL protein